MFEWVAVAGNKRVTSLLSRACCVTPRTHHPPARARFTGDNLDRKFNVSQVHGDTVPPGPRRSSLASCQLAEQEYVGQTTLGSFEPAATGLQDWYHSSRPQRDID